MAIFLFKNTYNHMIATPPHTHAIHKRLFGLLPSRAVISTTSRPPMPLIRFLLTAFFASLCITSAFLAPPAYAVHDDSTAGICARTTVVRNTIVASIAGVTDCALVTAEQLAAIGSLSVNNSDITTLKVGDFAGLSALTELDLFGNPLDASAMTLLAGLPATVTAITNASGGICTRTKEVRNTIVSNINGVTNCASVTTAHLAAITSLPLSGASITTLKAGDFAGLSRLVFLDLDDNQISRLPAGIFSDLSALTELDLSGNPLDASAMTLLAGLPATVTAITNASGICTRTAAVRNAIVRNTNTFVPHCALV